MALQAKGLVCFKICSAWKNMINALEGHRPVSVQQGNQRKLFRKLQKGARGKPPPSTTHILREMSAPQSISDNWFARAKQWGTPFVSFYWRIIALQCCVPVWGTTVSPYVDTCVPALLDLPPPWLSHPSRSSQSTELGLPTSHQFRV